MVMKRNKLGSLRCLLAGRHDYIRVSGSLYEKPTAMCLCCGKQKKLGVGSFVSRGHIIHTHETNTRLIASSKTGTKSGRLHRASSGSALSASGR